MRCGAVPGYSTEQSRLLLDEVGWDLAPNLLVIGNLWSDNNLDYFVDHEWIESLTRPEWRLEWLLSQSHAWRGLRNVLAPPGQTILPVTWVQQTRSSTTRRVPPERYGKNLDHMLRDASARGVGVILLAPANRDMLEAPVTERSGASTHQIQPQPQFPWDLYFRILERVATRRGVPVIRAIDLLRSAAIPVDDAFLDEMHPTAFTNGLYVSALADQLLALGWPEQALLPDASPPLFDDPAPDSWVLRQAQQAEH